MHYLRSSTKHVTITQTGWLLQKNTGQNGGKPKLDLNVEAAWAQGITGRNVTTAIMDDGVDYMHPDLRRHFVSNGLSFHESCLRS